MFRVRHLVHTISASITLLVVTGCGGPAGAPTVEMNSVSGKVTVKGGPPASGTSVKYTSADGKALVAAVDADGSYMLTDVPLGDAKIAVTGTVGTPGMPGISGTGDKGLPIPPKYAREGPIPVFKVVKGVNKNNIDLTP